MEVSNHRHAPAALSSGSVRYPLFRNMGGPQSVLGLHACQLLTIMGTCVGGLFSKSLKHFSLTVFLTDDATFGRYGVKNVQNKHQWREIVEL
jgi:hypothetical protein